MLRLLRDLNAKIHHILMLHRLNHIELSSCLAYLLHSCVNKKFIVCMLSDITMRKDEPLWPKTSCLQRNRMIPSFKNLNFKYLYNIQPSHILTSANRTQPHTLDINSIFSFFVLSKATIRVFVRATGKQSAAFFVLLKIEPEQRNNLFTFHRIERKYSRQFNFINRIWCRNCMH